MNGPFPPLLCALGEGGGGEGKNKSVMGMGSKVDNIYGVGAGLLQMVLEPCPSHKSGPYTHPRVCP